MAETNTNDSNNAASTTRTFTSNMVPTVPSAQQSRWADSGVEHMARELRDATNTIWVSPENLDAFKPKSSAEPPAVHDDNK
ncbi:hypothetical protein B9479_001667 [Cryptococcus floricola]|uniref:Uncharacterized protein n=1 Tax=Cryptococcus floricola TaxID=2591691 RepID=A0A5D3B1Q5_9TREE|nr:hypothetical protein B9479_001667 [Cryptococcus floricola]